jgi:hypothetical protein
MAPLFADKDDLLHVPWSSFGFQHKNARTFMHVTLVRPREALDRHADHSFSGPMRGPYLPERTPSLEGVLERTSLMKHRQDLEPLASLSFEHRSATGISPERSAQIQMALISHGYLSGAPTGNWDTASVAAMRRLQSEHGWQTKFMPDARALIFLGLGPGTSGP